MIIVVLFVLASLLDLALTLFGLHIGMAEINPVVTAMGYQRMAIFKIAMVALAVGVYAVGAETMGLSSLWHRTWRRLVALLWLVVMANAIQIAYEVAR